jgi:hypothetical protein
LEGGDKLHYEIVKSKANTRGGKITRNRARTKLDIEVIHADAERVQFRWTQSNTTVDDPQVAHDPSAQQMLRLMADWSMVVEATPEGAILDLLNWEELKEKMDRGVAALRERLSKEVPDKDSLAVFDKAFSMFDNKNAFKSACIQEVQLFLAVSGKTYSKSRALEYDSMLQLPIGNGADIPSRTVFTLRSYDPKSSEVVIRRQLSVDPKEIKQAIEKMFRDFARDSGKPEVDPKRQPTVSMENITEYTVDLRDGWIKQLKHKKVSESDGMRGGELLTITRTAG